MYIFDPETNKLGKIRDHEIWYSSNMFKTKVFGVQKTDQEINIGESFGFRVDILVDNKDILRSNKNKKWTRNYFNYETVPFYLEIQLYSLKCKFWELGNKDPKEVFTLGKLKKSQVLTVYMNNPVKGLSSYLFLNFKDSYLSHWVGTVDTCLSSFKSSWKHSPEKIFKQFSLAKENHEYFSTATKHSTLNLSKAFSEQHDDQFNNPFHTFRESGPCLEDLDKNIFETENRKSAKPNQLGPKLPLKSDLASLNRTMKVERQFESEPYNKSNLVKDIMTIYKIGKVLHRSHETLTKKLNSLMSFTRPANKPNPASKPTKKIDFEHHFVDIINELVEDEE